MTIDPTRSVDVRSRAGEAVSGQDDRSQTSAKDPTEVRRDQVDISDEARALAEQSNVDSVPANQARLAEIQDRLDNGFYDQPEVTADIAKRILEAGDL